MLEQIKLGDTKLAKFLHFKYLVVIQSSAGDLLVAVNHRIFIAWSGYTDLQRLLTASRLPKGLRLHLLNQSYRRFCTDASPGNWQCMSDAS